MQNFEKKIIEALKSVDNVKLNDLELTAVKRQIIEFMVAHPEQSVKKVVRNSEARRLSERRSLIFDRFISSFNPNNMKGLLLKPVSAFIAVLVVFSGTTSFAAESALPGDALYTVKVGINENIRGALAIGFENEADWIARQAERRSEEAAQLAAQGRLSAEFAAILRARMQIHLADANQLVEEITSSPDASFRDLERAQEVITSILGSLEAQLDFLETLAEEVSVTIELVEDIRAQVTRLQNNRSEVEADIDAAIRDGVRANDQTEDNLQDSTVEDDNEAQIATPRNENELESTIRRKVDLAIQALVSFRLELELSQDEISAGNYAALEQQLVIAENIGLNAKSQLRVGAYELAYSSVLDILNRLSTLNSRLRLAIASNDLEVTLVPEDVRTNDTGSDVDQAVEEVFTDENVSLEKEARTSLNNARALQLSVKTLFNNSLAELDESAMTSVGAAFTRAAANIEQSAVALSNTNYQKALEFANAARAILNDAKQIIENALNNNNENNTNFNFDTDNLLNPDLTDTTFDLDVDKSLDSSELNINRQDIPVRF